MWARDGRTLLTLLELARHDARVALREEADAGDGEECPPPGGRRQPRDVRNRHRIQVPRRSVVVVSARAPVDHSLARDGTGVRPSLSTRK